MTRYTETFAVQRTETIEVVVEGANDEAHGAELVTHCVDFGPGVYAIAGTIVTVSAFDEDYDLEANDDGEWEDDDR